MYGRAERSSPHIHAARSPTASPISQARSGREARRSGYVGNLVLTSTGVVCPLVGFLPIVFVGGLFYGRY